jgi:hypothetical protein
VELGGLGSPDAVGFIGGIDGVGRRGVGERTDRRGPCVSEGRERRHRGRKARIKEENLFCEIRQRRARGEWAVEGMMAYECVPVQQPRLAGLISIGKIQRFFFIFKFK